MSGLPQQELREEADSGPDALAEHFSAPASDDDAMLAPTPDRSTLSRPRASAKGRVNQATETRRTLIPILLTLGVLLPAIGSLKWLTGVNSPFAGVAAWIAVLMLALGPILLALAAFNMMHVKRTLRHGRC